MITPPKFDIDTKKDWLLEDVSQIDLFWVSMLNFRGVYSMEEKSLWPMKLNVAHSCKSGNEIYVQLHKGTWTVILPFKGPGITALVFLRGKHLGSPHSPRSAYFPL